MARDLFQPVADESRLDPRFVHVATHRSAIPARHEVRAVYSRFVDLDGNFAEQFQTAGFDQRTWELALFAYLLNAGFEFEPRYSVPDFLCTKNDQEVGIEATTANPSGGTPAPTTLEGLLRSAEEPAAERLRRIQHEIPIRFGSPLHSKLRRRYWELPHVDGRPLVLAIESFAAEDAFTFGDSGLATYLYGKWAIPWRTASGDLVVTNTPVREHRDHTKVIPSGFFNQPDAEKISAVLFSNTGTIVKFGRMALQEGVGIKSVMMIRDGACYDRDPNSAEPLVFSYDVARRPDVWGFPETWGEGMSMFHNPHSLHPVDPLLFPDIAHHHCEGERIYATLPDFHPFSSLTHTFVLPEIED